MPDPLPRNVSLGRVIASRKFTLRGKPRAKVELRIGAPRQLKDCAYCSVQLVGVGDEKVRPDYGVDTVQALQLVSRGVEALLLTHGDRLRWYGEAAISSLHADPRERFRGAGLSEFLSDFASMFLEHLSRAGPPKRRGRSRGSKSR